MFEQYALVDAQFPWFFPLFAFIFGSIVGSFLNVCIYRIPKDVSIVSPSSHCACGKPIAWYNNLPILSWIFLRGKAGCCGRSFSIRYPMVEALTGLLFLLCWLLFPPGKAVAGMIFSSILICASFIDLDEMYIPDRFSIGGFVVGLLISLAFPSLHGFGESIFLLDALRSVVTALIGAFIGSALVLWIGLLAEIVLQKEAMGFGDVKLMGAIGAFCGWKGAVFSMFGGAILGTIGVVIFVVFRLLFGKNIRKSKESDLPEETSNESPSEESVTLIGRQVPFGPMLAAAALFFFFFFHTYVDRYFAEISSLLSL